MSGEERTPETFRYNNTLVGVWRHKVSHVDVTESGLEWLREKGWKEPTGRGRTRKRKLAAFVEKLVRRGIELPPAGVEMHLYVETKRH